MTKKTALYALHHEQGAKCIPFAGYDLPVWFSSIKDEHLAVRQHAGMFDISHMGLIDISGDGSDTLMSYLSCNSIEKAKHGNMIYSMFLNEEGMVLDDVMFTRYNDSWKLVVNGCNREKIVAWINKHKATTVTIDEQHNTGSFIAVQGPKAATLLSQAFDHDFASIGKCSMTQFCILNHSIIVSRTGYTGEDGFECVVPHDCVERFWKSCLEAGITPCGLGARDTLRIEKGFPLYGQELSETIHPFMTRYSWVLKFDHDFIGKEAVTRLKESKHQVAVMLKLSEPLIARPGYTISEGGHISSGTLLPENKESIAMAFVNPEYKEIGSNVHIHIRKKNVLATVSK